jgi:hypothetical protein
MGCHRHVHPQTPRSPEAAFFLAPLLQEFLVSNVLEIPILQEIRVTLAYEGVFLWQ